MGARELACDGPEPVVLGGFANGLHAWLCSRSMDMFAGQLDKSPRSLPPTQLPRVLWRGPEAPLLTEHRCHGGFQGKVV